MAGISLAGLRDRERHHNALFARRAPQPRLHKTAKGATSAFLADFAARFLGTSGLPASFVTALAETKAASTWDGYVGAARPWFALAEQQGFPALPADPVRFACWLADAGHAPSAEAALFMFRNGLQLFGSDWSASAPQLAHWHALLSTSRASTPTR
jgi:hypothetical protein